MTSLSSDKVINLDQKIDFSKVIVDDGSPVVMLRVLNSSDIQPLVSQLNNSRDHFQVYTRKTLPQRYFYDQNVRIPEILIEAELGYTLNTPGIY